MKDREYIVLNILYILSKWNVCISLRNELICYIMRDVFVYFSIYFDHTQFQELMNDLQICTQAFAIKFKRHTCMLTQAEYIFWNYKILRTLIWPYELLLSFKGTAKIYTPTNNQSFNFNIPRIHSGKCQKIMNVDIINISFSFRDIIDNYKL